MASFLDSLSNSISGLFKSDAEKQVDALYGNASPDKTGSSVLLAVEDFALPESYGESVVNQIYSTPASTLKPDPTYDSTSLSTPSLVVKAKTGLENVGQALLGSAQKTLIYVIAILLVAVLVYAAAPALVKRFT